MSPSSGLGVPQDEARRLLGQGSASPIPMAQEKAQRAPGKELVSPRTFPHVQGLGGQCGTPQPCPIPESPTCVAGSGDVSACGIPEEGVFPSVSQIFVAAPCCVVGLREDARVLLKGVLSQPWFHLRIWSFCCCHSVFTANLVMQEMWKLGMSSFGVQPLGKGWQGAEQDFAEAMLEVTGSLEVQTHPGLY